MRGAARFSLASLLHRSSIAVATSVATLAALAVLWRQRPALPELPDSLSSPVTTGLLEELVFIAAWLLAVVVVFLLLVHVLLVYFVHAPRRRTRALRPVVVPAMRDRSFTHAGLVAGAARPAFAAPFPLILRAPPETSRESSPIRTQSARTDPAPRIALLGPLTIAAIKPRRRGLRSQTQELLAYLALHAEGATTDGLVAVLWPEIDDESASRMRVWRAVSEVRSQLGNVIVRAGEQYFLDRKAITVDLDEFDVLLAQAGGRRDVDREPLLERALVLARGQPLAGTDYAWAAGEVSHLRAKMVGLLHDLGNLRLDSDNPTGALVAAEQAISLDAYNESAHRLAMRAESALRLREAVAERYERLCQELDTRLGLEPERETRLLYLHLLGQNAPSLAFTVE